MTTVPATHTGQASNQAFCMPSIRAVVLRARIFFTFKQKKIKSLRTELAELYAARAQSIKESNPRQAAKLYTKSAKNYGKAEATGRAAEQWRQAAEIYKKLADCEKAKECYLNAAFYFQQDNKYGTTILLLHEADKL